MLSSRPGLGFATAALAALSFGCTSPEQRAADPSAGAVASAPEPSGAASEKTAVAGPSQDLPPVVAKSFSKTLRAALQEAHDDSADNAFSNAVLEGKVSPVQYELMCKQNLAIFEELATLLSKDTTLPSEARTALLKDLGKITGGFREDLGMSADAKLRPDDVLPRTKELLTLLGQMTPGEVAVCAYQDAGGNAFGTHDLAAELTKRGMTNTKGFTVYTRGEFMELVGVMNRNFTDPSEYQRFIAAAVSFFESQDRMSNSAEFQVQ